MRRKYIVANWKMNGTRSFLAHWLNSWAASNPVFSSLTPVLCPPSSYLCDFLSQSTLSWGAQDVSSHSDGAFTGEISASMLHDLGCRYVIVGHSERRRYFHETSVLLSAKIERLLCAGLIPIFCIGETLEQHQAHETRAVLFEQLTAVLSSVALKGPLVIAYEPIWAIGTGHRADPSLVATLLADLRAFLYQNFSFEDVSLLYGGSVSSKNVSDFLARDMIDMDGFLVGSAALSVDDFLMICRKGESFWTSF